MNQSSSFFKKNSALFSYTTGEYITPKWLYDQLNEEFHFKLDPCTTEDNPLDTTFYYTKEDNGLEYPWDRSTFVNPPYGRDVGEWVKKAYDSVMKYGVIIVMLLPVRTDTKWFHDYIYKKPKVEIRFIRGRLKFEGAVNPQFSKQPKNNTAPFPSMIVIFR